MKLCLQIRPPSPSLGVRRPGQRAADREASLHAVPLSAELWRVLARQLLADGAGQHRAARGAMVAAGLQETL